MASKSERFWISFILRLAFGGFFLVVAIGQFGYGGPNDVGYQAFAEKLSPAFADTWIGAVLPDIPVYEKDGEGNYVVDAQGEKKVVAERDPTYYFLLGLPFAFAILSAPILCGIFLRPALRIGAILLVLLGIGNYVWKGPDLTTTIHDFFLAFLICVGLWFLGQEKSEENVDDLTAA